MPQDYILHKVEKGETISSLARKHQVEEHKIVAANPDTIELIRLEDRWEIRISEDSIIKIPQGEEKATAFIIKGNTSLGMGKTEDFELLTGEETIPRFPSEKISWDFSVEEGGSWRKLQLPQEKIGQKIAIVFKNQKLKSKNIQLEVYIERDNGREKLSELLIALDGEDQAEITKLELLDVNRNLIKRPISYAETLFARAQCTGMEGETLYFSLWEDDAKGAGHSAENEQNFISTKEAEVVNGLAEASFPLLFHNMGPIANQKLATGQRDEGKHHEYYVTATRYEGAEVESSSQNVDVNNPDYIPPPPKPKKPAAPKPKPQSKTPQLIHKDKVNATAKPPASAWKEPKIIEVYIRDTQGKEWTRRPKFGEKICIYIRSENLIEKKINLKLYDKDTVSNDLLYNKNHKIVANLVQVTIELTKEMQDKGGDFWYQNIFAEVLLYDTQQTVQSQIINVDRINFHIPKPEGVKVVTVKDNKKEKGKKKNCTCEERVKAFMRMLRIGEGTLGESGYTRAFGGNKITDLSKHPETNYGGSTAAGAYQIMRYTWWWLNGEELNDDNKKKGIYIESHNYIKKYKISDFKQESQDKLCVILMKHTKSGLIELIINGDIEKAIREKASGLWASLPYKGDNSRYKFKGKSQPATPMKQCLDNYERFFKDELSEISDLHLKKGFLKDFGYTCQCKKTKENKAKKGIYDINKAVSTLNKNVRSSSIGYCARYVRWAIEAGGLSTEGRPSSATNYDFFLPKLGFSTINSTNYTPIKGDIIVIKAFKGDKNHPYGHIAMYNGNQWLSDFKQRDMWAGPDYRKHKPSYIIFRWEEK